LFVALIFPTGCRLGRGNLHVKPMFIKRSFGATLSQTHLSILNSFECLHVAIDDGRIFRIQRTVSAGAGLPGVRRAYEPQLQHNKLPIRKSRVMSLLVSGLAMYPKRAEKMSHRDGCYSISRNPRAFVATRVTNLCTWIINICPTSFRNKTITTGNTKQVCRVWA